MPFEAETNPIHITVPPPPPPCKGRTKTFQAFIFVFIGNVLQMPWCCFKGFTALIIIQNKVISITEADLTCPFATFVCKSKIYVQRLDAMSLSSALFSFQAI